MLCSMPHLSPGEEVAVPLGEAAPQETAWAALGGDLPLQEPEASLQAASLARERECPCRGASSRGIGRHARQPPPRAGATAAKEALRERAWHSPCAHVLSLAVEAQGRRRGRIQWQTSAAVLPLPCRREEGLPWRCPAWPLAGATDACCAWPSSAGWGACVALEWAPHLPLVPPFLCTQ